MRFADPIHRSLLRHAAPKRVSKLLPHTSVHSRVCTITYGSYSIYAIVTGDENFRLNQRLERWTIVNWFIAKKKQAKKKETWTACPFTCDTCTRDLNVVAAIRRNWHPLDQNAARVSMSGGKRGGIEKGKSGISNGRTLSRHASRVWRNNEMLTAWAAFSILSRPQWQFVWYI